jgi:cytochrome c peroxidase
MKSTFHLVRIALLIVLLQTIAAAQSPRIGQERAVPHRLQDGDEFTLSLADLIEYGRQIFIANWTVQEGFGRPMTNGTGKPLADPSSPLVFPRSTNRISGPDANSCAGCHAQPYAGGGGDFVANVFVLAQRFDFVTFEQTDTRNLRGARDEINRQVTLSEAGNSRITIGMFGAGYIEMLARQITADLQAIRDSLQPGGSAELISKGISFGTISRKADGSWDFSKVVGIPRFSLTTTGNQSEVITAWNLNDLLSRATSTLTSAASQPPNLIIRPFHQSGRVVSLREFTNNAFNHHHGMQSTERFGVGADPDGDGVINELNRADITAATIFQATLPVPGQVIPSDPAAAAVVQKGQTLFSTIGCSSCHIPALPLETNGGYFTEPSPYNPNILNNLNLQTGQAPTLTVDLANDALPGPRLKPDITGIIWVSAYTDFKLHDITSGPDDPNRELLDQQIAAGPAFFAGNGKFMTRRLWGAGNTGPYFHHGQYTTLREAILAHRGESLPQYNAFMALSAEDQNSIIEFLKSLQVLPLGESRLVITDEDLAQYSPAVTQLQNLLIQMGR